MMLLIDSFLDRRPGPKYNCFDLVSEAWLALTGECITDRFPRLQGAFVDRKMTHTGLRSAERLKTPVTPCVAIFQRPRTVPHVGIWIDGRILHLNESGAEFTLPEIAKRYYRTVRYYR
jgi:hypothetical protein